MSQKQVTFTRKHEKGLQFSSVKINDRLCLFHNDKAVITLEDGEEFEVYWRMSGEPGSELVIDFVAGEDFGQIISKMPQDRVKWVDFTLRSL